MNNARLRVLGVFLGLCLALVVAVGIIYAASPTDTSLDGTWVNVNPNTRTLVKIVIAHRSGGITVHAFGACHPRACNLGTVNGLVYSSGSNNSTGKAFTAQYNSGFATDILSGVLANTSNGARLTVNDFEHYTDNSGRYDQLNTDTFKKKP